MIQHGAADVVSVDNQMDGGLANLRHDAAMCEVAGLPVLEHSLGELGIATYAGLHVLAATPNVTDASQGFGSLLAVDLDEDRVARTAERYERDAEASAFHDPRAMAATPVLPKF